MTTDPAGGEPDDADLGVKQTDAADGAAAPKARLHRLRREAVPLASALLLVVSGAVAAWLYADQYRPDEQTTFADGRSVAAAAEEATIALLSYRPESLDADTAAAKEHLTGEFLTYYSRFSDEIAAPAAEQKGIATTAAVLRSAVADLQPKKASVLVFVNQTTTSRERPEPSQTASSVMVTMTEVAGRWLISSFDPV